MNDDALIARKWCDLLGWTYRPDARGILPNEGEVLVGPFDDDCFVVSFHGGREHVVGLPTLATCALVRHAGRVEWPCQTCEGSKIERKIVTRNSRASARRVSLGLERKGFEVAIAYDGQAAECWVMTGTRTCPACVVDGKPTGRRRALAPEAVLLAAPRLDSVAVGSGQSEGHARRRVPMLAKLRGWVSWEVREIVEAGGEWSAIVDYTIPGHEGAREALRALAEGWREHLPVLADWMAAHGELIFEVSDLEQYSRGAPSPSLGGFLEHDDEPPSSACKDVPRSLAECPAVARWVLAWLAGNERRPCPAWDQSYTAYGHSAAGCDLCTFEGPRPGFARFDPLRTRLPAIYDHLDAAWRRETVVCPASRSTNIRLRCVDGEVPDGAIQRVEGADGRTGLVPERWIDCKVCAGLGRVGPEADA